VVQKIYEIIGNNILSFYIYIYIYIYRGIQNRYTHSLNASIFGFWINWSLENTNLITWSLENTNLINWSLESIYVNDVVFTWNKLVTWNTNLINLKHLSTNQGMRKTFVDKSRDEKRMRKVNRWKLPSPFLTSTENVSCFWSWTEVSSSQNII